jgi:hypothetical protein
MKTSKNIRKKSENPIHILHDIEDVNSVLTEEEIGKINRMFESIEEFNQITEYLEKNITENRLKERDLKTLYDIVSKLTIHREKPKETYLKNIGLTQAFFELPEILSKRLFSQK